MITGQGSSCEWAEQAWEVAGQRWGQGRSAAASGGYGAGARPRRPAAAMGSMSPALPKVLIFFLFF